MAQDFWIYCYWDNVNNLDGQYYIFDSEADAVALWNSTTPASGWKCACWEVEEANNYVFTQNQANAYKWK